MRVHPSHDGDETPRTERTLGRLLVPFALGVIILLTLTPTDGATAAAATPWNCLNCGDFGTVDIVLNVLLFIPLGVALRLAGTPWRRIVVAAFILAAGIETLQLAVIPGRDASLSDLLTDTTGGAIGALLASQWRRLILPDHRTARTLCATILVAWTASRFGTAWLLRPAFPETRWFAQIAPEDVYPANFAGTVLNAQIGTHELVAGEMPALHDAFRTSTVAVRAMVKNAEPTVGLASIVSVLDEERTEVLLLGQEGGAVRLRYRLRTADARLRTPSLRLEHGLDRSLAAPTELTGFLSRGRLSLSTSSQGYTTGVSIALSPGLGWALLLPYDSGLTPRTALLGTATLAWGVLLIVGYFVGRALPHRMAGAAVLALALGAVGLWSPSIVFSEATVLPMEVLSVALGSLTGTALARVLAEMVQVRDPRHTRPRSR